MNFELFISGRINGSNENRFSKPLIRVAIAGIALGLAVMIVAVAIVTGFQQQIRNKVIGFGAHIQIARFDSNNSFEFSPVERNQPFVNTLQKTNGISHIQAFGTKAGIIKTKDQIQGMVLKGVDKDFDWSFFKDKLVEGKVFRVGDTVANDSVIISRSLANLLNLKTGENMRMYFIVDNKARGRKFVISGIYDTGLEEFDLMYIYGDIRTIQKLNGWNPNQVSGFEVFIKDFKQLDQMAAVVNDATGFDLKTRTIRELYPQMFDWLELQDMNVIIILVLMVLVAAITMISTLLILILERTQMIGTLKALGASDRSVQRIFLYQAAFILTRGLIWGNITGVVLCLIQQQWGIIKLPTASYFVSVVPINLNILHLFFLNAGTLIICMMMLVLPSYIVSRVSPIKAIRFN
ncbi:MAG: ABC transporter permease [Bacteroidales bacterium]